MKYMLTWTERPQGSPVEYENAQKRILEVFTQWKAPNNFKIELFVIRVGDWGGYMLLDCMTLLEGMSMRAAAGATRKELHKVADMALRSWPA